MRYLFPIILIFNISNSAFASGVPISHAIIKLVTDAVAMGTQIAVLPVAFDLVAENDPGPEFTNSSCISDCKNIEIKDSLKNNSRVEEEERRACETACTTPSLETPQSTRSELIRRLSQASLGFDSLAVVFNTFAVISSWIMVHDIALGYDAHQNARCSQWTFGISIFSSLFAMIFSGVNECILGNFLYTQSANLNSRSLHNIYWMLPVNGINFLLSSVAMIYGFAKVKSLLQPEPRLPGYGAP